MQAKFDKTNFAKKILMYLDGKIKANELYHWNCGFLDEKIEDGLLNKAWATIHQINEINPDFQTTDEELLYLYKCLIGEKSYSDAELSEARMRGLNRRFGELEG